MKLKKGQKMAGILNPIELCAWFVWCGMNITNYSGLCKYMRKRMAHVRIYKIIKVLNLRSSDKNGFSAKSYFHLKPQQIVSFPFLKVNTTQWQWQILHSYLNNIDLLTSWSQTIILENKNKSCIFFLNHVNFP